MPRQETVATTFDELVLALGVLGRRPWTWQRTRDGAVLVLLFYTALRVTELRQLDLGQVDLAASTLRTVRRKGGKMQDVILHPTAREALLAYLGVRPSSPSPALFLAKHNNRTSVRSIQKMLAKLGREAGLGNRLHPHALRHACATAMSSVGVGSSLIQRHLAHDSLVTTERYLHTLSEPVRLGVGQLPAANLDALAPSDDPDAES